MFDKQPTPRTAPDEPDLIWQPAMIRGFITKQGKVLSAQAQRAWGFIVGGHRSFPVDVDFRMDELGAFLYVASSSVPRDLVATLESEEIGRIIDRRPGRGGGVTMRMFHPLEVAKYRVARADPQRPLPGIEVEQKRPEPEADAEDPPGTIAIRRSETLGFVGDQTEGLAAPATETLGFVLNQTEGLPTEPTCVAPGDVPVALVEALESHVGQDRLDVWLKPSRWTFGERTQLFVVSEYAAATVRRLLGPELHRALRAAGIDSELDILVDASLPPPAANPAAAETLGFVGNQTEGLTPHLSSEQSCAHGNPSWVSMSKQASKRDFWDEKNCGPEPEIVRRARELYDAIADWTLIRGTAMRGVLSVELGRLTASELEQLVRERSCDFNMALKELCRARRKWPHILFDKSFLKGTYGVKWPNHWDRARTPSPNKPR